MSLTVGNNIDVLTQWIGALARMATQAHPGVVVESTQGFPVIARELARHLAALEGGHTPAEAITAALRRDPERVWSPAETARILTGLDAATQRQLASRMGDPLVRCLARQTARFGSCPLANGPSGDQIRTSWGVLQDATPPLFEKIRCHNDEWRREAFPRMPAAWAARMKRVKATLTSLQQHARLIHEAPLRVMGIKAAPVLLALNDLAKLMTEIEETPDHKGVAANLLTRLYYIETRLMGLLQ